MELPDIGEHCAYSECNVLDFLPTTCNLCKKIFCSDHHQYDAHSCPERYKLDVQVPICPLCNKPVSGKRGQPPDLAVNEHMENNCQSKSKKVFENKCSRTGCKNKEMVSVECNICELNFCLRHRHSTDHDCQGAVAARRDRTLGGSIFKNWLGGASSSVANKILSNSRIRTVQAAPASSSIPQRIPSMTSSRVANLHTLQGNISEAEAYKRALQASKTSAGGSVEESIPESSQEELDAQLARAIALSLEEPVPTSSSQTSSRRLDCSVS